ncbi:MULTISPECIES: hypothetical protein [Citrobacter]|nr:MULTISPECIES: hypothetical protein [Citrobacter]EHU7373816.1 hypothetical protein [Citrobacter freundii]MDG9960271.1 hypothetical protein [Citrobacter portucalensis]MDM2810232.1 hypothetical protein [Citrobacter sp. Cpo103]MDN4357491.1 hypothetical protein [Citrobacter portucalensis]MDN4366126.1 hypothetical protein [Citrobacter portucalensis]
MSDMLDFSKQEEDDVGYDYDTDDSGYDHDESAEYADRPELDDYDKWNE